MKKLISFLALCLLLAALPVGALADTDVSAMLEALPPVEELRQMDMDAQRQVYDKTQAAYDAYMALSDAEKAGMENAEETFEALFGYFNTLVSPADAPVAAEEPGASGESADTASDLLSAALAAVIGILLAQKLITRRKMG